MKLIINYDLVNEILKANTGIDWKNFSLKMGIYSGVITTTCLTTLACGNDMPLTFFPRSILQGLFYFGTPELLCKKYNIESANLKLKNLASSLTSINIYTSTEAIKSARHYKTQFKLIRDEKKAIQQNKFLMLSTDGTFNADEISLQQEHIIGSKEYVLSIGEPKKAQSKATLTAFSRQI